MMGRFKTPKQCIYCGAFFTRTYSLTYHINNKVCRTDPKIHRCGICNKAYLEKRSLDRHIVSHKTKKTVMCRTCDQTFDSRKLFYSHFLSKHKKGIHSYTCRICYKSGFTNKKTLFKHRLTHMLGGRKLQAIPKDIHNAWNHLLPTKQKEQNQPTVSENMTEPNSSSRQIDTDHNRLITSSGHFNTTQQTVPEHVEEPRPSSLQSHTEPNSSIIAPSKSYLPKTSIQQKRGTVHSNVEQQPARRNSDIKDEVLQNVDEQLKKTYTEYSPFILEQHKIGINYLCIIFTINKFSYFFKFNIN